MSSLFSVWPLAVNNRKLFVVGCVVVLSCWCHSPTYTHTHPTSSRTKMKKLAAPIPLKRSSGSHVVFKRSSSSNNNNNTNKNDLLEQWNDSSDSSSSLNSSSEIELENNSGDDSSLDYEENYNFEFEAECELQQIFYSGFRTPVPLHFVERTDINFEAMDDEGLRPATQHYNIIWSGQESHGFQIQFPDLGASPCPMQKDPKEYSELFSRAKNPMILNTPFGIHHNQKEWDTFPPHDYDERLYHDDVLDDDIPTGRNRSSSEPPPSALLRYFS